MIFIYIKNLNSKVLSDGINGLKLCYDVHEEILYKLEENNNRKSTTYLLDMTSNHLIKFGQSFLHNIIVFFL